MLCIYKLQHDKYYIEKTTDLINSFQRHVDGIGSHWTRLYLPIMIIESIEIEKYDDIQQIINKYKLKYGSNNIFYDNI